MRSPAKCGPETVEHSQVTQAGLCSAHANDGPQMNKYILTYHTSPRGLQVVGYTSEKEFTEKFDSSRAAIIKEVPVQRVADDFALEFAESFVYLFRHSKIDAWRIRDMALLIGDAAHAVTPYAGPGSNITIEDAEALGYLLQDVNYPEAIPPALQKFMRLRKDRVEYVARRHP
ncbi:hypothetical protein F4818DRAFT_437471 [Hypoxylon cercidicola]|nr:hypothetical protein F4818DRAFT_437471 [Hypoxylon cercidicola]